MIKKKRGKIIIPADAHPWDHELHVAKILALAGHIVEFIPKIHIDTPDILLDGIRFEIKSPKTNKMGTIERRLKEAVTNQSCNIIISSLRTKDLPDYKLQAWLVNKFKSQPQIKKLLFINKRNQIIDISKLI